MPISIRNKWLMEIKLPFSYFSVFIDSDSPNQTLEKKSGQLGDSNQTFVSVALNSEFSIDLYNKTFVLCSRYGLILLRILSFWPAFLQMFLIWVWKFMFLSNVIPRISTSLLFFILKSLKCKFSVSSIFWPMHIKPVFFWV